MTRGAGSLRRAAAAVILLGIAAFLIAPLPLALAQEAETQAAPPAAESQQAAPAEAAAAPVEPAPEAAPAAPTEPPVHGSVTPFRWTIGIFDFKWPILMSILVFSSLVLVMIRYARRNPNMYIRPLAGITAIEEAIGRATEMGRPVLYVPGIDNVNNIQTIYSMVILQYVAKTVAQYGTPLIVSVGQAFVTTMAEETVKQGFLDAGVPDAYKPGIVRYQSDEQFAFTAATNGIILREKPAANLLLGSFFAESLMMAETGFMAGSIQVAGTANVHQLPFFVVACDYTLIGEEFFAATAYLSREPNLLGTIKAQDYFKVGILVILAVGLVLETYAQFTYGPTSHSHLYWLLGF
jgi:hypothetical protein